MSITLKTKVPGPASQKLMERRNTAVARGPFHATPVFARKAHGALIEDVDGNVFVDFACGIGVVNVGHTPEAVTKRISEQAHLLLHGSFNVTPYESYVRVCEKLNQVTPGSFPKKSFLVNSGAEAVENAVKIARTFTNRKKIVAFDHAFHGRTFMAMALTAKEKPYREGFDPLPGPVIRVPFPYPYRSEETTDPEEVSRVCFEKFKTAITPDEVAAVFLEPVLGEGGFVVAPKEFLKLLSDFCTAHKILLVADEIQTGFGRTGTLFASEQLDLVPDIILTAKGIAAGLPLAAVTGKAEVMDSPQVGGIGGTYGGNPVACEAALGVFEIFEKTDLLQKSKQLGKMLEAELNRWQEKFPLIGEARGLGPMRAIELVKDRKTKEPYPEAAKKLMKYAYENGVILLNAGTYSNVIRFLLPLSISEKELRAGLAVVEKGLETL